MNNEHAEILGKPISVDDIFSITEHAGKLANIIREWLPVAGDSVAKTSNPRTAADFFSLAAKEYENCELVRNPDYSPFNQRGHSYHGFTEAMPFWNNLCSTLDELATLYHWEGISDHTERHGWNWWGEDPIPSADPNTLDRLERIIAGLRTVATAIKCSEAKGIALAVPEVTTNDWVRRRSELGETVEDQMAVLYKNDTRIADRKSTEIAEILGCTSQAIRKADNKVWKMFQGEKGRRKTLLSQKIRPTKAQSDNDD